MKALREQDTPRVADFQYYPALSPERTAWYREISATAQTMEVLGGTAAMLVLTRKSNQSIMIADDVEISVLSIVGDKVRIGIEAPKNIPIFRKEVYLQIQREQAEEHAESPDATPEAVDAALGEIANGG